MVSIREQTEGLVATAAITLIVTGCVAYPPHVRIRSAPSQGEHWPEQSEIRERLVDAHNLERAEAHLPPLMVNPALEAAATRHARDMADRHRMSHRGSDGSSPFRRMEQEGYHFLRAGENVACGQRTLDSLMSGWMRSLPHRRNILGNFSEIGGGFATADDGMTYWCVTFGSPFRS